MARRRLVTPTIENIRPYVPGKPVEELERELGITEAVKLASNENPLGPSPKAVEAIKKELVNLGFYPEGDAPNLRARLAERLSVDATQIVLGNGSNEILELVVRTFATPAHHAVVSDHAFLVYNLVLMAAGVPFTSVPMRQMTHDLDAMKDAIVDNTRVVFIANPNNPTGTYNTKAELTRFLRDLPDDLLTVVDEAYFEYVEPSDYPNCITLQQQFPNLIVTRTFSKVHGLAGLRVGFGVMTSELANYVHRVREPFNCNRLAQIGAEAALSDHDFVAKAVELNRVERAKVREALNERGLRCGPSETNFVLFEVPTTGQAICNDLLKHGVIVRPMAGYGLPQHIRMTIGLPEQNDRFLEALDAVLR